MKQELPDKAGYWWCQPYIGGARKLECFGAVRPILIFMDGDRPYVSTERGLNGYCGPRDYWSPCKVPVPAVGPTDGGGHTRRIP